MKKILVVEDEYYARKSIVKILQESDLDIQVCGEAENGMKAIELLEEYKDIALVIVGNLVGGKLIRLLGYEKGYLLMAGITTLMTICALIVYFWKNREQRNGGDVCEI